MTDITGHNVSAPAPETSAPVGYVAMAHATPIRVPTACSPTLSPTAVIPTTVPTPVMSSLTAGDIAQAATGIRASEVHSSSAPGWSVPLHGLSRLVLSLLYLTFITEFRL
ncbi:hypothetical protein MRX96_017328 [Rhipicephalus microplus]